MERFLLKLILSFTLLITACDNSNSYPENKIASPELLSSEVSPSSVIEDGSGISDNSSESVIQTDGHSTENALDWAGTYEGILPCADCDGIQTSLILNQDYSYELRESYIKNGKSLNPQIFKGHFRFDQNQPALIHLNQSIEKRVFFIGEGYAEARDNQTGKPLSETINYKLKQKINN